MQQRHPKQQAEAEGPEAETGRINNSLENSHWEMMDLWNQHELAQKEGNTET